MSGHSLRRTKEKGTHLAVHAPHGKLRPREVACEQITRNPVRPTLAARGARSAAPPLHPAPPCSPPSNGKLWPKCTQANGRQSPQCVLTAGDADGGHRWPKRGRTCCPPNLAPSSPNGYFEPTIIWRTVPSLDSSLALLICVMPLLVNNDSRIRRLTLQQTKHMHQDFG